MAREYFSLQRQDPDKGFCHKSSPFCACMLFLLIALIIAAIVTAFVFLIMLVAGHDITVDTTCGKVEGTFCPHSGVHIFEGIPYAEAPVGDLRWANAKEMKPEEGAETCWEGTYAAKGKKDACVQSDHSSENVTVTGSEDCLYLNVYTPNLRAKGENSSLPVMVFIHGEKGADPKYQPSSKTAKDMNIVVVTLQYRLGPLGFLVLNVDGLDKGNYGISDQVQALLWVSHNIKKFGGNPDDVTLVGQGTGATCVWALVASPQAKGLFHRAWVMSGAGMPVTGLSKAARSNKFILDATGCDDAGCLRNVSAEEITKQVEATWMKEDLNNLPRIGTFPYARIVDDKYFLIESLTESLRGSMGSDVPVLVGSASHSVDDNPGPGQDLKSMTQEQFMAYLDDHITKESADEVLPLYNFTASKDPEYKLTAMISDSRYTCSHDKLAKVAADFYTSPIHRYIVRGYLSSEVYAFGSSYPAKYAFRGWDLYALLGDVGKDMPVGATDADKKYQEIIREMALSFMKEGGPKQPEGWKEYPESTALISDHTAIVDKSLREQICNYWNDNLAAYRAEY